MQGMQSNSNPEQRGLTAAPSGPLEAAQRYLERQAENKAALVAMDDEEHDSRPAWLRRWSSDARSAGTTAGLIRPADRDLAVVLHPVADTQTTSATNPAEIEESSGGYTNGYMGQSIEAAFAFETVYHFETEFEAEATEDWLDLSGRDGSRGAHIGQEPTRQEPTRQELKGKEPTGKEPTGKELNERKIGQEQAAKLMPEIELRNELRGELEMKAGAEPTAEAGPMVRPGATPAGALAGSQRDAAFAKSVDAATNIAEGGATPDPRAVRAAIFRLAQESTFGRTSPGLASHAADQRLEFAEVARRVWGQPSDADRDAADVCDGRSASDGRSAAGGLNAAGDMDAGGLFGVAGSLAADAAKEPGFADADSASAPLWRSLEGLHLEGVSSEGEVLAVLPKEPRSESSAMSAAVAPAGSSRAEGAREPVAEANTLASVKMASGTAGEAPALAHDATNLLSALKLYSELLALSGVLHARHKHYAQDLKLLAARSEVLIGRLLGCCSVEASQIHALEDEHAAVILAGPAGPPPAGIRAAPGAEAITHLAEEIVGNTFAEKVGEIARGSDIKPVARPEANLTSSFEAKLKANLETNSEAHLEVNLEANPEANPEAHLETNPQAHLEANLDVSSHGSFGDSFDLTAAIHQALHAADLPNVLAAVTEMQVGPKAVAVAPAEAPALNGVRQADEADADARMEHAAFTPGRPGGMERSKAQSANHEPGNDLRASALAQAEDQARPDQVTPINLVDLLRRWGSLLSMIAHSPVEVNFGPYAGLPIRVAEEAIERILVNLVHNAMTATRGGGSIRIGVGRAEKRGSVLSQPSIDAPGRPANKMVLTVDDSGCGMDQEQIRKILGTGVAADQAPGYLDVRTERTRRGIGLQIVRELVSASGGELAIYSRTGAGTRIEMTWPAVDEAYLGGRIPPASAGLRGESVRASLLQQDGATAGLAADPATRLAHAAHIRMQHREEGVNGAIAC